MNRAYYPVRCRLDGCDRYLIWHTDDGDRREPDGVIVSEAGQTLAFQDGASLAAYAEAQDFTLAERSQPAFVDFDAVRRWLRRKRPARLDCPTFLNAWNLLGDVAASVGEEFDADKSRTDAIYDKLFWGCNLPPVTPAGQRFVPRWTRREQRVMRDVLGGGLEMLRRRGLRR